MKINFFKLIFKATKSCEVQTKNWLKFVIWNPKTQRQIKQINRKQLESF